MGLPSKNIHNCDDMARCRWLIPVARLMGARFGRPAGGLHITSRSAATTINADAGDEPRTPRGPQRKCCQLKLQQRACERAGFKPLWASEGRRQGDNKNKTKTNNIQSCAKGLQSQLISALCFEIITQRERYPTNQTDTARDQTEITTHRL